ncbi:MAG: NigD-like protein [Clostridium sp.]|nr:NigD-like protein [Bacteroides sp.]MCM1197498.1 NigD-like protein [Clostridium sp.]
MKRNGIITIGAAAILAVSALSSCSHKNNEYRPYREAIVTVKPLENGSYYMQLTDNETLCPEGYLKSPFKDREVRAYTIYTRTNLTDPDYGKVVTVERLDSIRTKDPIMYNGQTEEELAELYGNDPVEIMNSWMTSVEDGYLTLHFFTHWSWSGMVQHSVNLIAGMNPDDPYEVRFMHNANKDLSQREGYSTVAFRLGSLPDTEGKTVKLTLKWKAFGQEKSTTFDYRTRPGVSALSID